MWGTIYVIIVSCFFAVMAKLAGWGFSDVEWWVLIVLGNGFVYFKSIIDILSDKD